MTYSHPTPLCNVNRRSHSEIYLTLKIQGQSHGQGQTWWSHLSPRVQKGYSVESIRIPHSSLASNTPLNHYHQFLNEKLSKLNKLKFNDLGQRNVHAREYCFYKFIQDRWLAHFCWCEFLSCLHIAYNTCHTLSYIYYFWWYRHFF